MAKIVKKRIKRLTKLQILNETIAAYTLKTRAIAANGKYCVYYESRTKRKCAVGRCLIRPALYARADNDVANVWPSTRSLSLALKPKYRGHPMSFWRRLQLLHDDARHWTTLGLSYAGKRFVEDIHRKFRLTNTQGD